MKSVRLTTAQALVRYLIAQKIETDSGDTSLFPGVFAIFGHGNVSAMGEALYNARTELPTYRAHNEQAMAHAAIAYAKQSRRRQVMICTTSIGPGATNMLTACALAHVNRLPVLLLPGDTFASRRPDPVLQQLERPDDATVSVNECFRPVSRFFDRITRPEQLLSSVPAAIDVLLDPAKCGPATIALPQDVQAIAYDFPTWFFETRCHSIRRQPADQNEVVRAAALLRAAERPMIICGGGVKYANACELLQLFAARFNIPVAETQAGKGSLPSTHSQNVGAIGVTGSSAANTLARSADVVLAVGTRLQDFTTGSRALFEDENFQLIQLNASSEDAAKHRGLAVVADASNGLEQISTELGDWVAAESWRTKSEKLCDEWTAVVEAATTAPEDNRLPTDAQVIGAINRASELGDVVVAAAGGIPGELHKLWRCKEPTEYHVEYGYSCMGYEIAGGLGVKMASSDSEVIVMLGDGSYMMLNSELATSVFLGRKLIIILLDNKGFACINRLQVACGASRFNNLFEDCEQDTSTSTDIDFVAHARSMGAEAELAPDISGLEAALTRARKATRSYVIVINTDPNAATQEGGAWWDVAVSEVSEDKNVVRARKAYVAAKTRQI